MISKTRIYSSFWLAVIAIGIIIFLPNLLQHGMFLDGITYGAISRNMAIGIGDFWYPHYSATFGEVFHSHPPLVFGLQSLFFKLFGDVFFVERLYSLIVFSITGYGIALSWRLLSDEGAHRYDWLPIMVWLSMPLVWWAYSHNVLECTMTMFDVFAVYAISRAVIQTNLKYLFLGGLLIFLALLSKGVAGLFPLLVPMFLSMSKGISIKRGALFAVLLFGLVFGMCLLMFLIFPDSRIYASEYLHLQLLPALDGSIVGTVR